MGECRRAQLDDMLCWRAFISHPDCEEVLRHVTLSQLSRVGYATCCKGDRKAQKKFRVPTSLQRIQMVRDISDWSGLSPPSFKTGALSHSCKAIFVSRFASEIPQQLIGRQPIIHRADFGAAGIYYRALVGPFASAEKAAKLCSTESCWRRLHYSEKLTSALTHHAPDGGAAEAPAVRGMEGDALKSTLHETATKSRKKQEVVLWPRSRRSTLVHAIVDIRR
jgi:hypothetical protein